MMETKNDNGYFSLHMPETGFVHLHWYLTDKKWKSLADQCMCDSYGEPRLFITLYSMEGKSKTPVEEHDVFGQKNNWTLSLDRSLEGSRIEFELFAREEEHGERVHIFTSAPVHIPYSPEKTASILSGSAAGDMLESAGIESTGSDASDYRISS